MKNIVILMIAFIFVSVSSFSQKGPSDIVKKDFSTKYSTAKSVKWANEEKNEWEAEFTLDGKKMSASYDNSGKWLEAETTITEKELPTSVITTLNKDFSGYKKRDISIFESTEMKGFELGLKKGETSIEVIFDNNGKILKKTDVKEADENDEKPEKVKN